MVANRGRHHSHKIQGFPLEENEPMPAQFEEDLSTKGIIQDPLYFEVGSVYPPSDQPKIEVETIK